jgi:hypothetical protein
VAAAENMIMTLLDAQRLGNHYCTLHPAVLTADAKQLDSLNRSNSAC